MPVFQCTVCGRKVRAEYDISCTGYAKRNVEKSPCCCGKEMIEYLEDQAANYYSNGEAEDWGYNPAQNYS